MTKTIVHLMRHGEVHNPEGVLYGRLPGYVLSELGHKMAERVSEWVVDNKLDVTYLVASPLERAQQTATPTSKALGLEIHTDPRVIEAGNQFEGKTFGVGDGALKHPQNWWRLRNPFSPSWGEPYVEIAARMRLAVKDAREAARGHEAIIVSHQLPVWTARLDIEQRRFFHDPRKRECSLASLTSITFEDDQVVSVLYREPAGDLIPEALRKKFVGGA
ncbi:MAG: hypothetical protein JWP10_1337 [Nocardioidaceae bacterium]|nr:hypothetical protein [Nocardioidaceae bacterium]